MYIVFWATDGAVEWAVVVHHCYRISAATLTSEDGGQDHVIHVKING